MSTSIDKKKVDAKKIRISDFVLGLIVIVLLLNIPFTVYLYGQVSRIQNKVDIHCDAIQYNFNNYYHQLHNLKSALQNLQQVSSHIQKQSHNNYNWLQPKLMDIWNKIQSLQLQLSRTEKNVNNHMLENEQIRNLMNDLASLVKLSKEKTNSKTEQIKMKVSNKVNQMKQNIKQAWNQIFQKF